MKTESTEIRRSPEDLKPGDVILDIGDMPMIYFGTEQHNPRDSIIFRAFHLERNVGIELDCDAFYTVKPDAKLTY